VPANAGYLYNGCKTVLYVSVQSHNEVLVENSWFFVYQMYLVPYWRW